MNAVLASVGLGLAGKQKNFVLSPLFVSRKGS